MNKKFTEDELFLKNRIEDNELVGSDVWEVIGLKFHHRTWAIQPDRYYAIPYKNLYGLGFITYPGDDPDDELTEKDYWVVSEETPSWLVHAIIHAVRNNNVNTWHSITHDGKKVQKRRSGNDR